METNLADLTRYAGSVIIYTKVSMDEMFRSMVNVEKDEKQKFKIVRH